MAGLARLTRATREAAGPVYLWPCNVTAWNAWLGVQTQWRSGMAGFTGLDYAGVRTDLHAMGHSRSAVRDIWPGIKACERAVLKVWADERERLEQERQRRIQQPGV